MTPLRILVVEDDCLISMLLSEMLAGMGHSVCAVETTEADAVIAAARWKPDLMIVDAQLAEGDGISAIEQVRRRRAVPHLFVSGHATRVTALRPDAIVLRKPFYEAELAQGIARALDAAPAS